MSFDSWVWSTLLITREESVIAAPKIKVRKDMLFQSLVKVIFAVKPVPPFVIVLPCLMRHQSLIWYTTDAINPTASNASIKRKYSMPIGEAYTEVAHLYKPPTTPVLPVPAIQSAIADVSFSKSRGGLVP